jgi:hypothetical protein
MSRDIVIARYEEDVSWVQQIPKEKVSRIFIYNKGSPVTAEGCIVIPLPNLGRETHTYLHHVLQNYNALADTTIFLPGSVIDAPWKLNQFRACMEAYKKSPAESVIVGDTKNINLEDLKSFQLDEYKITNKKNKLKNPVSKLDPSPIRPLGAWFDAHFPGEGLYTVSFCGIIIAQKKDIRKRSPVFYNGIFAEVQTTNPEVVHYAERVWANIFSIPKERCIGLS